MRRTFVAAVFVLSSCANFAETKPSGQTGPTAPNDAGSPDGSLVADEDEDGGTPQAGGCTGLVDTAACEDFEAAGWEGQWMLPTPAAGYVHEVALAPTGTGKALHVVLKNAGKSLALEEGSLYRRVDGTLFDAATRIELSYRFMIAKAHFGFARLGGLVYTDANAYRTYALQFFGHSGIFDGEPNEPAGANVRLALNRWRTATLVFVKSASKTFRLTVTVDKTQVSSDDVQLGDGMTQLAIGAFDTSKPEGDPFGKENELDVWFDDIILRLK